MLWTHSFLFWCLREGKCYLETCILLQRHRNRDICDIKHVLKCSELPWNTVTVAEGSSSAKAAITRAFQSSGKPWLWQAECAPQSREKPGLTQPYIQVYVYHCTQFHIWCSILLRKLSVCKAILSTANGTWVRLSLKCVTELITHSHCGQIPTIQPGRAQGTGSLLSSLSAGHSHRALDTLSPCILKER